MEERELESEKYKDLLKDTLDNLLINNLEVDLDYINSDESRVGRNEDWIKGLYKDIYIEETLLIMRDLIASSPGRASLENIPTGNRGE